MQIPVTVNFRIRVSNSAIAILTSQSLLDEALRIGYNAIPTALSFSTNDMLTGVQHYGQVKFVAPHTQSLGSFIQSTSEFIGACGCEIAEVQIASAAGLNETLCRETVPYTQSRADGDSVGAGDLLAPVPNGRDCRDSC